MPRPPNSAFSSNGADQKCLVSPMVADPSALTATSAPMVIPLPSTVEAVPRPPLKVAVKAPVPAPAVPVANSRAAACTAAYPSSR